MEESQDALIRAEARAKKQGLKSADFTITDQDGGSGEQAEAVYHILVSNDQYICVDGLAGTGKTTMMERLKWIADEQGIEIKELRKKVDFFVRTNLPPVEGIFFDGQIFDAYRFVNDLVRKAKSSIVLIDNYVDDTVLAMLDKRTAGVTATIYTQHVSQQLQLDIDRHNAQYDPIVVEHFNRAHDRFLLIDDEVYHLGASLKDLGRKWFAFTLMHDLTAAELICRISGSATA